jgi:hypothetical protein
VDRVVFAFEVAGSHCECASACGENGCGAAEGG